MAQQVEDQSNPTSGSSRSLPRIAGLVLSGAIVAGSCVWGWIAYSVDELAAKQQLEQLGALVVTSADGRSIASITLSTVKDPSRLHDAVVVMSTLSNVKAIEAGRTSITNGDLELIGKLKSLESLSLSSTSIDDEGVVFLAGLDNLESLQLNRTPITSVGLDSLKVLKSLRVLNLSDTGVSGGLERLKELPQLNWIVLQRLVLEEGALSSLGNTLSLTRVTLNGSTFSESDIASLKSKLPNISINL